VEFIHEADFVEIGTAWPRDQPACEIADKRRKGPSSANPVSLAPQEEAARGPHLVGDQEAALERFARALRLSPADPLSYRFNTGAGIASLLIGRYDEAIAFCEDARRNHGKWGPTFRILAAGYAHLGQAAKAAEALTRYRELEPAASIAHLRRQLSYRNAEQAERLWEGLRKAGMPE
jgi:tetratricopeptide (TPR) repeat protein